MQTEEGQSLVPNWSREIDTISSYIDSISTNDEIQPDHTEEEQEEWMLLAQLNMDSHDESHTDINTHLDPQYWQEHNQCYTQEQIGNMPSWIHQQKDTFIIPTTNSKETDVNTFNEAQTVSYKIVFDHYIQACQQPLLLIITGLAGSGKSYVIDALKNLLQEKMQSMCILWNSSI